MTSRSGRPLVAVIALPVVVLFVGVAVWATSGGSDDTRSSAAAATSAVPRATANRFQGARAFSLLREQVRDYGHRPAGSPTLRALAERLRELMPLGRFENVPGHPGLRNVIGTVRGRKPVIVIGAHYDVEAEPAGFVGANDGAAGTAAVVELARVFAETRRPKGARGLRFVLFDGEEEPAGCEPFIECGLRGSRAYAERNGANVHRMILLDYIAEKSGLRFRRELGSHETLWNRLRSAARAVGVGSLFPSGSYPGGIADDHIPFAERGIPAIDIIDFDYPPRDSLEDDLDKVSARSLDAVGEAVYRLVARQRRR